MTGGERGAWAQVNRAIIWLVWWERECPVLRENLHEVVVNLQNS